MAADVYERLFFFAHELEKCFQGEPAFQSSPWDNPAASTLLAVHPASRVAELTPRLWKEHFATHPLRSDLNLVR